MMFIEVFAVRGALDDERRRRIGERLVTDLMPDTGDAPAEVMEAGRSITQVVFHEPVDWYVGGARADASAPRYLVRASVPEDWREQMGEHLVRVFTAVLADVDDDPDRLYRQPDAWIHVVGVPEGGCGVRGEVVGSLDIVKMITRSYRDSPDRFDREVPPGRGLDPVCGMVVPLEHAVVTREHEGTTYAFCSKGCADVFAEETGVTETRNATV
ncbi:YHS domain-containing protein [Amycolatopsis arida]|uniref:YHS domain-containing protein n=1 Tax=Amycolatopsis arida TaxID=587909 RepID=A0A1I6AK07_9PSEU|nr:YHS domain-containing protein [Amycolatopsis arida]TDX87323.1 YHS domain-containing protein [Amycolatopsis arida]SFQ68837.1 YHS domain-containing protein [Amycolatopsis arida]